MAFLSHNNLSIIYDTQIRKEFYLNSKKFDVSYIVKECIPYGSIATLIENKVFEQDETLVRTYFHQLVDVLSYLHGQAMPHLNICLNNIMIGDDY